MNGHCIAEDGASTNRAKQSSYGDSCVIAYNTSRHESCKYIPLQLMFGCHAVLPFDLEQESKVADTHASEYLV